MRAVLFTIVAFGLALVAHAEEAGAAPGAMAGAPSTADDDRGGVASSSRPTARSLLLVLSPAGDVFSDEDRTSLETALELLLAERLDVDVQSNRGLRERVELVGEKQLTGCDTSACLAEIASALGARFVVFSRGIQLGNAKLLRLEIFDDQQGRTLALATAQASDVRGLLVKLPEAAGQLVEEAGESIPRRASTRALVEVDALRAPSPWVVGGAITAAAGAVVAVVGGVTWALSSGASEDTITATANDYAADPTLENARAVRAARVATTPGPLLGAGQVAVALGVVGVVGGVVGCAVGLLHPSPTTEESP